MSFKPSEKMMKLAIEVAKQGVMVGQSPFGSVIARGDEVIMKGHNQVWATSDPTAHAEITTIRMGCQQTSTIDMSGCVLYSTCEPCPMCLAACHWAKFDYVVYGATIEDAKVAGFSELTISAPDMVKLGGSPMKLLKGFMAEECKSLFGLWLSQESSRSY
jgi:tRNA(Arg) A34 adenosine deaminase TadA